MVFAETFRAKLRGETLRAMVFAETFRARLRAETFRARLLVGSFMIRLEATIPPEGSTLSALIDFPVARLICCFCLAVSGTVTLLFSAIVPSPLSPSGVCTSVSRI